MEAREVQETGWLGRSTVRSLRPGTWFDLIGLPLDRANPQAEHRYAPTGITHLGINNLGGESIAAIARRLTQAPTHPAAGLDTGDRITPVSAPGPMSALVVGPDGQTTPNGPDELWCDALGRVKIRFHWQLAEAPDDRDSCWVRVLNRQAGPGMGWQWLPRIGQEILVDFLGGDIDRPVILGALYNGRGEGGIPATPGGDRGPSARDNVFDPASDHRPGGQGNTAGGNNPAWHGAAETSHCHPAALSGFKSKEFGAQGPNAGHTQLALDDTDNQQHIQLNGES